MSSPPIATSASSLSFANELSTASTPPSTLYGFVRVVPRIVPPRGRIPETSRIERSEDPVDEALPAFADGDHLVPAIGRAPDDGADDRVQAGAVAAGEDADAHLARAGKTRPTSGGSTRQPRDTPGRDQDAVYTGPLELGDVLRGRVVELRDRELPGGDVV